MRSEQFALAFQADSRKKDLTGVPFLLRLVHYLEWYQKLLWGSYDIMVVVRRWLAAFTFFLGAPNVVQFGVLSAAPDDYTGKRIVTIQFEPKEQPLEAVVLNEILPVRIGNPLRMPEVRAAIDRLFATGCYTDIEVEAETVSGGVAIRFHTKASWFVGRVSVEGKISEPPNAGQLTNSTRLELGQPYSEDKVKAGVQGIRQVLEANGFYEQHVQPRFIYDSATQQIHLRFEIDTGPRARFGPPLLRGDLKVSPDEVVSATGWRRFLIGNWKPATQSRVQSGLQKIRQMYRKQDRLMAKVSLDSMDYERETRRVTPALDIAAGPKVAIRTFGAKFSDKQLKRYVPIYEEGTVDRDLLVEGARNLRDLLQADGYFNAEVVFKEQRIGRGDKANIDYLINRGQRHKLVHIGIRGNRYFDTETIRERMFLATSSLLQFRHGRYSESFRRRDEEAIANLYRSNGFRDVSVTSEVTDNFQGDPGKLAVTFVIDEGPQWTVGKLEVIGIQQVDANQIVPLLSCSQDQPFSEFSVASDRDSILAYYYSQGFPDATFEWNSRPGARPNSVDLRFIIHEGSRQRVAQVLYGGLKTTRPSLVNRNLDINPGDPLSPIRMADTQHRLYDLGVFAKVDMAIQNPEGETPRKYVVYEMEEASRYSITGGLGAELARIGGCQNCLESPGGSTGFSPRVSLDMSRLNLWGLGHSVSFRSRVSTLQRRGLINYSAPRLSNVEGRNLSFTALYDSSRDVRTFTALRREVSAQLSQRLSKPTTALFRFSYRRSSVSDLAIQELLVPLLWQPARIGIFSGSLIQDRRDDSADPRKGIYNTLDFGVASRYFGSQRSFLRGLGRNATYHRVSRNVVLARELSLGILRPFSLPENTTATDAIPLAERFFGGGASSHRGFPENQAGPREAITGFPLGGNALLFHNTELRFPLIGENIGGVLFHDAGNVYSTPGNISFRFRQRDDKDFDYMAHAVGFGIRYRTPIGPVRVDLAYSVNSPRYNGFKGSLADLLKCGPAGSPTACVSEPQRISRFQFFFSIGQTF